MKRISITPKRRRLLALGCSHGILADPAATEAVLKFKKAWKPDVMIHLGDFCDTTAFRAGARGTSDEAEPIQPDIQSGLDFLEKLECNLVFLGNHEDRIWRLCHHYNAITAMAAGAVRNAIEESAKRLGAELVPWHIMSGWRKVADYSFGHGYFFNEQAPRDHAEAVGNVVFAHTHRTGMAKGRRLDNPSGYCVGTLAQIENMDYAKSRRSTLGWSQGFYWAEYSETNMVGWLHEHPRGLSEWILPV